NPPAIARLSENRGNRPQPAPRCDGTSSKVSRRCWSPQCLSRGGPGVQYHRTNATLRGHEEQSCDLRGGRKPLLDFKIAGARRRAGSGGLEVVEKASAKYS